MQFGVTQSSTADGEGEGVGFWLVKEPGQLGEAFGGKPEWKGLSVVFDTRDDRAEEEETEQVSIMY